MSISWPNTVAWHGKGYILDAVGSGSKDSVDPRDGRHVRGARGRVLSQFKNEMRTIYPLRIAL